MTTDPRGPCTEAIFEDRLAQAGAQAGRYGEKLALHYLSIESGSPAEGALGHDLKVQQRLGSIVRRSDTLALLPGRRFAIIQWAAGGLLGVSRLAGRLLRLATGEGVPRAWPAGVGAWIGVSLHHPGMEPTELKERAERALTRAMASPTVAVSYDAAGAGSGAVRHWTMYEDLQRALQRRELFLEFQPMIDLETGRTVCLEALVRWRHPQQGRLLPGEFIPQAERSEQVVEIGSWVLAEACRLAARWQDGPLAGVKVAVNLSAVEFISPGFVRRSVAALRRAGLPPRLLELELTERVLFGRSSGLQQVIEELRAAGAGFSIDDFGTGHSSMVLLRDFPVDKIKVPKTFAVGLGRGNGNGAIVDAIVKMSHALGKQVVVEGVESRRQAIDLKALGCDSAQGYFFGRPTSQLSEIPAVVRVPHGANRPRPLPPSRFPTLSSFGRK